MPNKWLFLLLVVLIIAGGIFLYKDSRQKALYAMQERCGVEGRKLYDKEVKDAETSQKGERLEANESILITDAVFHYNKKVNKCLYSRSKVAPCPHDQKDRLMFDCTILETVTDIYENKDLLTKETIFGANFPDQNYDPKQTQHLAISYLNGVGENLDVVEFNRLQGQLLSE